MKKAQAGTKVSKTKDMFNTNPAQLRSSGGKEAAKLRTMPSQGVKNRASLLKKPGNKK